MISVEKLIGNVRTRFKEIFRPDRRWDEWRSFYNGWVEGRTDLLLNIMQEHPDAYEFYNPTTGHAYVDYIDEFMKSAKDMITDHINKKGPFMHENEKIVRNITYRIFTE